MAALALRRRGRNPKTHGLQRRPDRKITTLLAQAAELAIRQETESVNLALLERAAAAGIFNIPAEDKNRCLGGVEPEASRGIGDTMN